MAWRLIERGDPTAAKLQSFVCPGCGWRASLLYAPGDPEVRCPVCGVVCDQDFNMPRLQFFHEGWQEHIAEDPIYVSSMRQLREECDKRDCRSTYDQESGVHYDRGRKRWV